MKKEKNKPKKKKEIEEKPQEELEETLEEKNLEEELESILSEPPEINSRINQFLSNPWKTVSLWETGNSSFKTLEELVPEEKKEKTKEQDIIDYKPMTLEDQGKYSPTKPNETERIDLTKDIKDMREQKTMYEKAQNWKTDNEGKEQRDYITHTQMKQEYKILKEDTR